MTIRQKIMLLLAGSFILLSPLSVAPEFPYAEAMKWPRVASTVLIILLGLAGGDLARLGPGSQALLGFIVIFFISGSWAESKIGALLNKGMFASTCGAGIALACSLRSASDLRSALRFLGFVSGGAALVVLVVFRANPDAVGSNNRMALMGINPNMMGHAAVPLYTLCLYLATQDARKIWRLLMIAACGGIVLVIMATGCRGAVLTASVGTACVLAPLTRKPGVLIGAAVGLMAVAIVGYAVLSIGGSERMLNDMTKNTREYIWRWALIKFGKSPIIGVGWMGYGLHAASVLNIYLQALAEAGLVGFFSLVAAFGAILVSWYEGRSRLMRLRLSIDACHLALALVAVEMVHGLTESDPLLGAAMATLSLGLGVGLIDRVPRLIVAGASERGQSLGAAMTAPVRRRPSAQEVLEAMRQGGRGVLSGPALAPVPREAPAGPPSAAERVNGNGHP